MKKIFLVSLCTMLMLSGCADHKPAVSELEKEPETVVAGEITEEIEEAEETDTEIEDIPEKTEDNAVENTPQPEEQKTPPLQPDATIDGVGFNDQKSWWFKRNSEHIPPTAQQEINIRQYDAYYIGDTSEKIIYLTFDEGYEAGYTAQILDVLKENEVEAMFFVTGHYLKSQPELVKRMADEGHLVGNHSYDHLDHTAVSDDEMVEDIESCQRLITETIGYEMPKFFRPPAGTYSIRTLEKAQELGYKTIFWSFAYKDWDTSAQPTVDEAYNMVMENYHNGCIMLLHAVSEANTNALDSMIKSLKNEGYEFRSLMELP